MRVLVTGGAGFIGSALVRHLVQADSQVTTSEGVRIVALDSLTRTGSWRALGPSKDHPAVSVVTASILDQRAVADAVASADVVIHCAAETSVDESFARGQDFTETNVHGTQLVFTTAAAAGVGTFVHFSTDEVYGPIEQGSAREDRALNPTNPYAHSKAEAEAVISQAGTLPSMRVVVVRPSNNYGPWQVADNLIPRFVTLLSRGERAPLYGTGEHRRCWVHVDDTVAAVRTLMGDSQAVGAFNIAGEELSNVEVTQYLLRSLDLDWSSVQRVPGRSVNDVRYCNDESRLVALGYMRRRRFTEEMPAVVEHYRQRAGSHE